MIKNICASVKDTQKNYLWGEMKNLEVLFSQHSLSKQLNICHQNYASYNLPGSQFLYVSV